MPSTEEQLCCPFDIQKNSLNFVKLIAALQVFLGHAVTHFELLDNIPELLVGGVYFIEGVPIFFGISGFLIYLSVSR